MLKLKRYKSDVDQESQILINSIINSDFLSEVSRVMKKEYLLSDSSKILWSWIFEYYKNYNQCPGKLIQDIFNTQRDKLDDNDAKLIHELLTGLNQKYGENINVPYLFQEKAFPYIRKRALEEHISKTKSLVELGQIDEAEKLQSEYHKVSRELSKWVDPNDPEFIKHIRNKKDEGILYKFPGEVGNLIGPFKRGWLVACQSQYGTGKTWFMKELGIQGSLNRLKVAEFNLEMTIDQSAERYYKRILARNEDTGFFIFTVADCRSNQTGTCKKKNRKSKIKLYDSRHESKPLPQIESWRACDSDKVDLGDPEYKPCCWCRDKPEHSKDYIPEFWFIKRHKDALTDEDIIKKTRAINRMYNSNMRLICYPRFTATIGDIISDLDRLEYDEGFIPDIVIIDYVAILAPEYYSKAQTEESMINSLWVRLAKLASVRNCCVITASQLKTSALKKRLTDMGDASQSARAVYAHSDLVLGLSSTSSDKEIGIARLNVIKHRHMGFDPQKEIILLQQLELGQVCSDSIIGLEVNNS